MVWLLFGRLGSILVSTGGGGGDGSGSSKSFLARLPRLSCNRYICPCVCSLGAFFAQMKFKHELADLLWFSGHSIIFHVSSFPFLLPLLCCWPYSFFYPCSRSFESIHAHRCIGITAKFFIEFDNFANGLTFSINSSSKIDRIYRQYINLYIVYSLMKSNQFLIDLRFFLAFICPCFHIKTKSFIQIQKYIKRKVISTQVNICFSIWAVFLWLCTHQMCARVYSNDAISIIIFLVRRQHLRVRGKASHKIEIDGRARWVFH